MPLKRPAPSAPAKKRAKPQPKQVGSQFGLVDPGNPFAGLGGTPGAGAHSNRPNLTEQVALAKARRARITPGSGGLISPAQRKAEEMASSIVETKARFATPPPEASTVQPRRTLQAAVPSSAPGGPRVAGRTGVRFAPGQERGAPSALLSILNGPALPSGVRHAIGRGAHAVGDLAVAANDHAGVLGGPAIGKSNAAWVGRNVLDPAVRTADKAVATGLRDTVAKFTGIGGPSIIEDFTHPTRALNESRKQGWQSSAEAAQSVMRSGLKLPNVNIPVGDLSFTGTAYAGTKAGDRIPFSELAGQTGWGLKPAAKASTIAAAKKRGWTSADIDGKSATDLVYMKYNDPPSLGERLVKGFAGDLITGGASTVGAVGLASEAAQGRGLQAAGDLVDALKSTTPGLSNHPALDTAVAHPLFAYAAVHGGLKTVGSLGHLRRGLGGERKVPLAGQENLAGEQQFADRGRYSKNYTTAAGQALSDLRVRVSPKAAGRVARDAIDEDVRHNRNEVADEHRPVQVAHRNVALKIPDDRKTQLMAWVDAGGEPGLRRGIAHYDREVAAGNKRGQAMGDHYRQTLENGGPKTPEEQAYVDTFRTAATQTSTERQHLGLHGATAQTFRQYETPILFAAEAGDRAAIRARDARDLHEELYQKAKSEGKPTAFAGKISEIGRDIKRHTKKAEKATATVERQQKAWDDWNAEDKAIRAERPKLPPPSVPGHVEPVLKVYGSLKDASAARAKAGEGYKVEKQGDGFVLRPPGAKAPEGVAAKHPPGTLGPHRKAVAEWRQRMQAHQAKKPPKPSGVSRAGGKRAAHEVEVSQQSKRLEKLTAKQRESLPIEEQIALAKKEYEDATQAFIDQHHAEGGIEPAYVERTKIKSGIDHPSRLAGKMRVTNKMQREYRSSGESVLRGEFVYDPRSVLHANAQVQRLRQHVGTWQDIGNSPLAEPFVGDGVQRVPAGKVAVTEQNYRSAAKTAPSWDDQPVSMHEVDREHGIRSKVAALWESSAKTEGEIIPKGERVVLLPEAAHKRIIEWAKPLPKDGKLAAYDRMNANYQRILIGIYPSTWLGNAPGSIPLAAASGALHPKHYTRAFGKDRIPVPDSTQGLGVGGSQLPIHDQSIPMRMVGKGREFSMHGEDFSARAAWNGQVIPFVEGYLPLARKVIPALDKIMPEKWKGAAHQLNKDADEVYAAMASGKWGDGTRVSPELEAARSRMTDHVEEFMGVASKPESGFGRGVGRAILFHRWLGHILKLNLVALPLHHPRRAMLINAIATYGNQYRQENGVYPSWMSQFLPLTALGINGAQSINGNPGMRSAGVGQLTPLSSAMNLASAGTQAFEGDPLKLAAGLVNPLWQPAAQALLTMERNQTNREGEKDYSVKNAATAAAFKALLIGSSKFQPGIGGGAGYEPGSSPLTGMKKKEYYKYVLSPSGKGYTRVRIKWEDRPGARPLEGTLGDAMRVIGLPLEWSPTGGHAWNVEQTNNRTFGHLDDRKRRQAAQKKRQHHG